MAARLNLDGKEIKPLKIILIGGGGFIGSHICEKIMNETSHNILVLDTTTNKIHHIVRNLSSWRGRFAYQFPINGQDYEQLIQASDLVVYCAPLYIEGKCTSNSDGIFSTILDGITVAKFCMENHKRLIHISSSQVYGTSIRSCLPIDHPLQNERDFNVLNEDYSPCIFSPVKYQGWSYACAIHMIERFIYAGFIEHGLEFTIVRPFNWMGSRMDLEPGIDGERFLRILYCFLYNLWCGDSLQLLDDGGESWTTVCHIKDAMDAVLLIIDNPERANGHVFNVGNPDNGVTMKGLAEMMIEVYAQVCGKSSSVITNASPENVYNLGYYWCDRLFPDISVINTLLGWSPTMPLNDLLQVTLMDQHQLYSPPVKEQPSIEANLTAVLEEMHKLGFRMNP